ncbi:MAG: ion transporter [Planctomycetes bacterium]|nr:ion transporter [Planctomycetota bacterium]
MTEPHPTLSIDDPADVPESHIPSVYDLFISVAAVISISMLIWQWTLPDKSEVGELLLIFDWAFCLMFFLDFLRNIVIAKRKLRYLYTWGPFDLISSIPVIYGLRATRLARVFRIVRLVRGIRILVQVWSRDRAASVVALMMASGIATIIGVSSAVLHVERDAPGSSIKTGAEAAWWGVVTVSTVGYGDLVPITKSGRILAVVLMVVGIGLFATFAGAIANIFMRQVQRSTNTDSIEDRLIRMERHQLEAQRALHRHLVRLEQREQAKVSDCDD